MNMSVVKMTQMIKNKVLHKCFSFFFYVLGSGNSHETNPIWG